MKAAEVSDIGHIIITDQLECIRILAEHSLLTQLVRPPKPANAMAVEFEHENYWAFGSATYDLDGQPSVVYCVGLLPKDKFSKELASELFMKSLDGTPCRTHDEPMTVPSEN